MIAQYQGLNVNQLDELRKQLREKGILKPGIHWKSDPYGQIKPWNPVPIYNIKLCEKFIKGKVFDIYAA